MINQKTILYTNDDIANVVQELSKHLEHAPIMTFQGMLGAGKTTLIKELFKERGIKEIITSPTFTYMQQYKQKDKIYYHFDLYRLSGMNEFLAAGFDEYLFQSNSYSFVEWPEIIKPLLIQAPVCNIFIEYDLENPEIRKLKIDCICNR